MQIWWCFVEDQREIYEGELPVFHLNDEATVVTVDNDLKFGPSISTVPVDLET